MRNFKKFIAAFIAVLSLLAVNPAQANAAWKQNNTGWWYTEGSSWATGWKQIDGNWYYFNTNGYMAHDCWIGNYYLNSNGAWTLDVPQSTSTIATTNDKTTMVYVASSGNGKKYHSDPNCSNMKGTRHITLSEAQSEGYTACKKCY